MILSSCAIIRPGEVAVRQSFGKLKPIKKTQGLVLLEPITTRLVKIPTRTINREVFLNLPSKEGLNVAAEISILYHVDRNKALDIINEVGINFERVLILSTFRSASADVCAKFFAKDMHSGMRSKIESEILAKMKINLEKQANGIDLIAVLMKSIQLPRGLANSIERKLQAEQDAMRMEFVLNEEKLEAERKIISAKGEREAQIIISEGLTNEIIKIKAIEAFKQLSNSNNSKVIITDGKTPLIIDEKGE